MYIFYSPGISSEYYTFNELESKHCIKVLRLEKDSEIFLIDGKGGYYRAIIIDPDKKSCKVRIIESKLKYNESDYYCHIAISPTKNIDRFEFFLEKATEIGINEITPVLCERSERKSIRTERMEKVLISAIKQSVKAYLPKLNNITPFNEFISKKFTGQKFIAHYENIPDVDLKKEYKIKSNVNILIGPEGDFSPTEISLANTKGFIPVSLGRNRLRTETAGIVAVHTISLLNV